MTSLRSWLRKEPQPVHIRCKMADGTDKKVKVDVNDPRRWARLEETIQAMEATAIEALDAKDVVTRAVNINSGVDEKKRDDDDDDDESIALAGSGSVIFNASIAKLARVINEAHDNAAKRHQEAYREGFQVMSELTKKLVDRDEKKDKLVDRLLRRIQEVAPEEVGNEGGDMMGMFTQAALQRIFTPGGGAPTGGPGAPMNLGGIPIPPEYAAKLRDPKVLAQLRKILENAGDAPAGGPGTNGASHKPKA